MSWAGCQNIQIYVNFHLKKSLEIFEKKSADKIWSNKDKGIKISCPVIDRVNTCSVLMFWLSWILVTVSSSHFQSLVLLSATVFLSIIILLPSTLQKLQMPVKITKMSTYLSISFNSREKNTYRDRNYAYRKGVGYLI